MDVVVEQLVYTSVMSRRMDIWDYMTMSAVVMLASSIGIYHVFAARKSKNAREFLVSSHDLGLAPIILSTVASFVSAVGILGFPIETYTNGAVFIWVSFTSLLIIPLANYLYLPIFFNLGTSTIFEYLEFRFNRFMRIMSSLLLNLQLVLYTSCVIYAPALALNQVTGLHLWSSVISIGVICILYTSMGGLKAVVWADVAQMIVMIVVVIIIVVKGAIDVGGLSEIWRIAKQGKRSNLLTFSQSSDSNYTTWTMLVGGTVHFMGPIVINQVMMQRYLSNKSLKKARCSLIGGCIGITMMTVFTTYAGLILYARYHDCDPLLGKMVTSRDQLMALFGIETLSFIKGLPGVFVGTILCATLSTLSSTLNSLTAVTMEDYIRPYYPHISESKALKLSKLLGIFYGTLCVALVAVAESMGGVAKAVFSISGMTTGPVLSLFTVGMLFPWVSTLGAACGFFTSFMFTGWACIGSLVTKPVLPTAPFSMERCNVNNYGNISLYESDRFSNMSSHVAALIGDADLIPDTVGDGGFPLYAIPALWYTLWSVCISIVISMTVSLIFGTQNPSELDPKLISPITRNICMLFPVDMQIKLGYGPRKRSLAEIEARYSELPLKNCLTDDDFIKNPNQSVDF